MSIKIADTHIHIWDLEKADYPWLNGDTSILNRSYALDEIAAERKIAGVITGVLVQASGNAADTALMLAAARQHEWIGGVVGWLPLADTAILQKELEENYLQENYFKGVRHQVHDEKDAQWLLQPAVLASLAILATHDIPYDMVGVSDAHLETVLTVAEKIPALRIVLDHLNQPPVLQKQYRGRWFELMTEAAKHPNLYAKISGLGTASGNRAAWNTSDIQPFIEWVIGQFGVDRCFCGSDWPVSSLTGGYVQTWQNYTAAIGELVNDNDQEKILYSNAVKFYSL